MSSDGIVVFLQGRYGTGARKIVCRSAGPYHANVAVVQDKSSDRQIWAVASQTSPEAAAAMGRNGEMTKWMKPSVVVWKRRGCPFAQHTAGEKRRKRVWLAKKRICNASVERDGHKAMLGSHHGRAEARDGSWVSPLSSTLARIYSVFHPAGLARDGDCSLSSTCRRSGPNP